MGLAYYLAPMNKLHPGTTFSGNGFLYGFCFCFCFWILQLRHPWATSHTWNQVPIQHLISTPVFHKRQHFPLYRKSCYRFSCYEIWQIWSCPEVQSLGTDPATSCGPLCHQSGLYSWVISKPFSWHHAFSDHLLLRLSWQSVTHSSEVISMQSLPSPPGPSMDDSKVCHDHWLVVRADSQQTRLKNNTVAFLLHKDTKAKVTCKCHIIWVLLSQKWYEFFLLTKMK